MRTRLTLIENDRFSYRGVDAVELAARHTYEEVAEWLWTGELRPGAAFSAPESSVAVARRAVDALPEHAGPADRLRVAAIAAAVTDPLRFDLSEEAVLGTARVLIPTLVAALPPVLRDGHDRDPIARRLWTRLSGQEPDERRCRPWTRRSDSSSTTIWRPPRSPCASPRRRGRTPTPPSPPGSA